MVLSEDEAHAFLAGLNDLRLYVASGETPEPDAQDNRDALVEWLAFCQDSLLTALME